MNIAEHFDGCLKLKQWFFFFKDFLDLFDQIIDHLLWQVDKRNILWILLLVIDNLVVKIVNKYVHDELLLVGHIGFGYLRD